MEALVILVVAAGLSAVVVWRAMAPEGEAREKPPRRTFDAPEPLADEPTHDGFVIMPTDGPVIVDDRPPPALSLLRLVLTIAFVAALGVMVVAVLGWLVKLQLDQYFNQLGS